MEKIILSWHSSPTLEVGVSCHFRFLFFWEGDFDEVLGFEALATRVWGASKAICKEIIEQGRQEEAMAIIEKEFSNSIPNEIELNDFIGFRLEYYMELWDKE